MIDPEESLPNRQRTTFRLDRICRIARLVLTACLRVQVPGLIKLTVAFGRRTQLRETNLIPAGRREFITSRNLDPVRSGGLRDDRHNFMTAETALVIELADQFLVRAKYSRHHIDSGLLHSHRGKLTGAESNLIVLGLLA